MRNVVQRAEVLACVSIGYVELRAALSAALRDGRVPEVQREPLLADLERLWERVDEIPVDHDLLRQAGKMCDELHLRAYDAVHLAGLRQVGESSGVSFACWDSRLREAAAQLGFALIPAS